MKMSRTSLFALLPVLTIISLAAAMLAQAPAMVLTTTAWQDGGVIPPKYTQAGEQVSPALTWTNVPANAASLVLHMYDADASPTKGTDTQVHWLMWNMPPTLKGL